jgi:DNA polymerase III sliding clamp (beta) subunit (PCNA family)
MKINRIDLVKALEVVKPGLTNKDVIEQAKSFAFMDGRLVTYNDNISISYPVPGIDFTGAIQAEEFYKLLSKMKTEDIELEVTDSEILITAGKMKAGMILQSEIVLPLDQIEEIGKWTKLPENFSDLLSFVISTCSNNMARPILTTIHIAPTFVEASDSYRLKSIKNEGKKLPEFLIPANSAREVIKFKPDKVSLGSGWVHFMKEEAILSCRIFQDNYPTTTAFFEVKGKEITFPPSLTEIMEKVIIFSKRDTQIDEQATIEVSDKEIEISAKSNYGWFKEKTRIKYTGKSFTFIIAPSFLLEILKISNTCIVGDSRLKFTGENWESVIMLKA